MMKAVLAGVTLLFLFGCSSTAMNNEPVILEPTGNYAISVKSGGREITDLNAQLVRRVELRQSEFERLVGLGERVSAHEALDQKGVRYGMRVRGKELLFLGIEPEDVIIALGKRSAPTSEDFPRFVKELKKSGEGTITFDRKGTPRKLLLSYHQP